MQKGVAGQRIGVQMVSASDGTAFTGAVTVYVTGDAGSQAIGSVASGVCTHEGNGYHSYAPAQAETNYDLIAFTFTGSGAVPVTVQVYTAINPVTAVPTAAANATAVRSELGLTGTLDSAFDAVPTAAENGAAGWNRMLVDHTSTGSFGYVVGLFFQLIENVTGWRFTSKALEQSPSGSGASVVVGPLVQTNSQRTQPAYIETYQFDRSTLGPFRIEDSEGNQYDLAGVVDWILIVWDKDDNELGVVAYADLAITSSTNNAVMDQYSFAPVAGQVANAGRQRFALRRPQGTSEQTAAAGIFNVIASPRGPTP